MKSNIKVVTENFRAIGHAAIQINGITVVAGENSSGKSTISKLLYELFNTVSNYEILVKEELMREFSKLFQFFEIVYTDSKGILNRKEYSKIVDLSYEYNYKNKSFEEINDLLSLFLSEIYSKIDVTKSSRYNYIVSNILGDEIDNTLENITSFINQKIKKAIDKVHSRPISLFTEKLLNVFRDENLPKSFEVLEEKEVIVSLEKPTLSIPFSVQKAIYIDSPMSLGAGSSSNKHWSDLAKFIFFEDKNRSDFHNNDIYTSISKNIKGEAVKFTLGTLSTLTFLREDGKEFNLTEVATGIKAFSIIQLLLKNGHIDNRTLLIIDEPESHLHPQWIVEYARMIVLLHKHIGVKFFLASHNPDMVSAIRYIAEKEGVLDNVNYYLAEKAEGEAYLYNYIPLGSDISPIFKSFNIAIERISQYSIDSDNEDDDL
ncbi:hypothetical protein HMPREF9075_00774 [Capnocytophaga sp. oral taxon 332 str. F0381]|uniref:AAA family ATPase n=1 Tax=Capnocytophaga sp. oral taxon 332 TaxID=712213 RepID=UPI0002A456D1|nr:AAA family ATPase [Capnocytophaga sp. oral taxon 332]EKY11256.1 hypothetical protein HMPREF9075_00774 [Capnocytophaga sp. oral taxon 332 str. F0381]